MIDRQTSIALLREELEQQRTRAEAAEADLRACEKAYSDLRRLVDAWKEADADARSGRTVGSYVWREKAEEALRHG